MSCNKYLDHERVNYFGEDLDHYRCYTALDSTMTVGLTQLNMESAIEDIFQIFNIL